MILGADGATSSRPTRRRASSPAPPTTAASHGSSLHGVPRDGEAEIDVPIAGGARRTLLVARRPMPGDPGSEVVLRHRRDRSATARSKSVCGSEKLAGSAEDAVRLEPQDQQPADRPVGRAQILQAHKIERSRASRKAAAVIEDASLRIAELIRELAQVVRDGRQDAVDELLDMSANGVAAERERAMRRPHATRRERRRGSP